MFRCAVPEGGHCPYFSLFEEKQKRNGTVYTKRTNTETDTQKNETVTVTGRIPQPKGVMEKRQRGKC